MAKKKKSANRVASTSSMPNTDGLTLAMAQTNIRSTPATLPRPTLKNIVQVFDRYFGEVSRLENWQRLCYDVGIEEDLPSITKCRAALRKVWINIYDLIDAVRAGNGPPTRFKSQGALASYTIRTNRVFPKKKAKEGGPVRQLLAHILS